MTRDRYNTDWPDSIQALNEAIRGLELAMSATHWRETFPKPTADIRPYSHTDPNQSAACRIRKAN